VAGYYALVFLFFLGLVVFYTWPAALQFDRVIPGRADDQYQNIWSLWWLKRSLLDLRTDPFFTGYLFYPYGTTLYLHALAPLLGLITLPWTILAGPVASYNAAAILGLTFTGVTGAALGKNVSRSRWGGLAAGYVITFSPIHFSYVSLGQLEFLKLWPFLLYLTFLVKLANYPAEQAEITSTSPPRIGPNWLVAGAAASLVLGALVTLYYAAYAALFTVLYLVLRGLREWRWQWWRPMLGRVAVAWLFFNLCFGYFSWQVWQAEHSGEVKIPAKPLTIINESVTVHGYFTDFDGNISLGNLLGLARTAPLNRVHYIGFGVLLLAVSGLLVGRKLGLRQSWHWLVMALFFACASFGPTVRTDPHVNPAIGPVEPWLPWNWIQQIPLLNITHSPTRMALLALICVALLVAQGAGYFARWVRGLHHPAYKALGWFMALALAVWLALEGPAWPAVSRTIETPPQVSVIENDCARINCGAAAVLDLPFTQSNYTKDADLMLYSALREKPVMGGYLSREVLNPYLEETSPFHVFIKPGEAAEDIFRPVPRQSVVTLLNVYNIRYITVDQNEFSRTYALDPSQVSNYLLGLLGQDSRLYSANGLEVYRVPFSNPANQPPLIVPTDGWRGLEKETPPKRWMGSRASLVVYSFQQQTTSLSFEAVAFHTVRHLAVTLNGQPVGTLEIKPDGMASYQLPNLTLRSGENLLILDPIEEPESPAALGPNSKDTRLLSIALRQVKLGQ
jgi:hypothetical protein